MFRQFYSHITNNVDRVCSISTSLIKQHYLHYTFTASSNQASTRALKRQLSGDVADECQKRNFHKRQRHESSGTQRK